MNAFSEIDSMVKSSQNLSDAGSVGSATRLTGEDLRNIISRGDESGSKFSYYKDRNGFAEITPDQARMNLYRDVYKLVKGNNYDQKEADRAAMDDMEKAQRARHFYLRKMFHSVPSYDRLINYAVPPHRTFVPGPAVMKNGERFRTGEMMSSTFGRRDSRIPIYDKKAKSPLALGFLSQYRGKSPASEGKNVLLSIIRKNRPGKNVALHEGTHSFVPYYYDTRSRGDVSYMDRPGTLLTKEPWYALDPSEALVGVASEKARLRANGHNETKGLGRIWAEDVLKNGDKLRNGTREVDLNVSSARWILKTLHDMANSKDATEADKKNYNDFLDQIDHMFEVAKNGRGKLNVAPEAIA